MAYEISPLKITDKLEDSVTITIDDGDRISYFRHDIKDNPVKVLGVNKLGITPVFETVPGTDITFLTERSKLYFGRESAISTILKMKLVDDKPHIDSICTRFKPFVDKYTKVGDDLLLDTSPYLNIEKVRGLYKLWGDSDLDINNAIIKYKHSESSPDYEYYDISQSTEIHVFDRLMLTTKIMCATFDTCYEKTNLQINEVLTAVKLRIEKIMKLISFNDIIKYYATADEKDPWSILQLVRPQSNVTLIENMDAYWYIDQIIKNKIDVDNNFYKMNSPGAIVAYLGNTSSLYSTNASTPFIYKTNFIDLNSDDMLSTFEAKSTYQLKDMNDTVLAELDADVMKELIQKISVDSVFGMNGDISKWDPGKLTSDDDLVLNDNQKKLLAVMVYIKWVTLDTTIRNICAIMHDLVYAEMTAWYEMSAGNFALLITNMSEFNTIKTGFNEVLGIIAKMGAMVGIANDYSTDEIAKARKSNKAYEYLYNVWFQQVAVPKYKERYINIKSTGNPGECAYFLPKSFDPSDYIYFPYRLENIADAPDSLLQVAKAGANTRFIPMFMDINATAEKAVSGALRPYYWDSISTVLADKDVVDAVTGNIEAITLIITSILSNISAPNYFDSDELIDKLIALATACNFSTSKPEFVKAEIKKRLTLTSGDDRINSILPTVVPNVDLLTQLGNFRHTVDIISDVFNTVHGKLKINKNDNIYTKNEIDIVQTHTDIINQIGTTSCEFDYFAALKSDPNEIDKINVLLPLFAFNDNATPTKCVGTKYNMCVIIHPEDEFKLITDEGSYTKWGDGSATTPTNPMIVKMAAQIKTTINWLGRPYYDDFEKYQKLYHAGSGSIEGSDIIKGSQIFGNQQKMLPFSVICIKK